MLEGRAERRLLAIVGDVRVALADDDGESRDAVQVAHVADVGLAGL